MMRRAALRPPPAAILLVALLAGCEGAVGGGSAPDGGGRPDATPGRDAGGDASREAGPEAGPVDAGREGGAEAGPDGATDASADATDDGSTPADPCEGFDPGLPVDESPLVGVYSGREYRFMAEPRGQTWHLRFGSGVIRSVSGIVPPDGSYGAIEVEASPGRTASKLLSISRCPGDFGGQPGSTLPPGCLKSVRVVAGLLRWKTPGATPPEEETLPDLYRCVLEPGSRVWLNIVHATDPADPAGSASCPDGTECTFVLTNRGEFAPGP